MTLKIVPNTNLKIIDIRWFSGKDTIGAVLVEDMNLHYVKAYIGLGAGNNEQHDAESIAQWGSKLPKETAESLFGPLPEWRD